jgi:hypothetical protein
MIKRKEKKIRREKGKKRVTKNNKNKNIFEQTHEDNT